MDMLTHLANHYATDKGTVEKSGDGEGDRYSPHCFTPFYWEHLKEYRLDHRKVLEVGVLEGRSLLMWQDFFPHAMIYGIDTDFQRMADHFKKSHFARTDTARLKLYRADQSKREELREFFDVFGYDFDMIIDDGGHRMDQQQICFASCFDALLPGGVYILEDLHTSNFKGEYGVKDDLSNTTLNMINTFVQTGEIKSEYLTEEECKNLTSSIEHIHVFDKDGDGKHMTCVVYKKGLIS